MTNPLTQLRKLIVDVYDAGELRTLCLDLGVTHDALPGEGTAAKARELIQRLERRDSLPDLIEWLRNKRPDTQGSG